MPRRNLLALCGATVALVLTPAAALAAGSPAVTVRIEGLKKTLLAPKLVHTRSGSITKGGAPRGGCPAASAVGALDAATRHRWSGKWYSSFNDYLISSILGAREDGTHYYWGIWVNNRFATAGACAIKLHRGDRLLFAVDSVATHEHPIALRAPRSAAAGHAFTVKVVWLSDTGVAKPLAGARVHAPGVSAVSDSHGLVTITDGHPGKLTLRADKARYIRAAATTVSVR